MNKNNTESSSYLSATAGQNVTSAATSRENAAQTNHEQQTGGELAAAPCSASDAARPEQGGENLNDEEFNNHTIAVTNEFDETFFNCLEILKSLEASKNFSSSFLSLLESKLLSSLEIKGVSHPAVGTRMVLRCFAGQDYIEFLSALATVNAYFSREFPSHGNII